jgi:hypothetical protein
MEVLKIQYHARRLAGKAGYEINPNYLSTWPDPLSPLFPERCGAKTDRDGRRLPPRCASESLLLFLNYVVAKDKSNLGDG